MPLRRAPAIVLRCYRVGEADKLAVFFTLPYGKLRGRARAARRPRSPFGGALEPGTEIELTFFEKESRELVSVDRCDIVRSRFSVLGEPILASTPGYVTDLVDSFALEREANPRLYRLLRATIGALGTGASAETHALYFEAWLLRLVGSYPRRKACPSCGRRLVEEGARYLASEHRLACPGCLTSGIPLSAASVGFIEQMWKVPPGAISTPELPAVVGELSVFHERIIRETLDKELRSRQVLKDVLRHERQR